MLNDNGWEQTRGTMLRRTSGYLTRRSVSRRYLQVLRFQAVEQLIKCYGRSHFE
ncbi:hypothetical protein LCGC14_1690640, partial [marine sediment metagenome]